MMAISFKGAYFPQDIILMEVRWYVAYPLSYRHVEELLEVKSAMPGLRAQALPDTPPGVRLARQKNPACCAASRPACTSLPTCSAMSDEAGVVTLLAHIRRPVATSVKVICAPYAVTTRSAPTGTATPTPGPNPARPMPAA